MGRHGFARGMEFEAEPVSDTRLTLTIRANDETRASYPFDFKFGLIYELSGDTLRVIYRRGEQGRGGHAPSASAGTPGFNVPLAPGLRFEDYRLEFAGPCEPRQVLLSPKYYISGEEAPYALENNAIPLRHGLFDHDAVILRGTPGAVTLKTDKDAHGVELSYPDMNLYRLLAHAGDGGALRLHRALAEPALAPGRGGGPGAPAGHPRPRARRGL